MPRALRIALTIAAACLAAYLSIFPLAELFTEVVVLRTRDAAGVAHETRVTIIDIGDEAWIRGRPRRGWFRRLRADSRAELWRNEAWHPVSAEISDDPEDADAFQRVMIERYGALYRFMDLMAQMSNHEVPVRLVARPDDARGSSTPDGTQRERTP